MKFQKLILKNIFSHKHTEIDLNDKGLALITGDNGSGKSSILKALLFCLFNIGSDSVVNNIIGANASTTLIGNKSRDRFIIKRHRKHKKYKNDLHFFINDRPVDASTNTELQKKLEKFLGLDYKSFLNVAAFSSEMVQFCSSTDVERKAVFEKILQDLDIYTESHKNAKEKLAGLNIVIDEAKHKKEIEERELSVVKKVLEAEEVKALEQEEKKKERINKIEGELSLLEGKMKEYLKLKGKLLRYERVIENLKWWLERHPTLEEEYFSTKQQYADISSKLEALDGRDKCPECNQTLTEEYKKQETIRLGKMRAIMIDVLIEYEIRRENRQKVVDKLDEIHKKVAALFYKHAKYDTLIDDIADKEEELRETKEEIADNIEIIQQWRSKIKKLSKIISTYKRQIKEAEEERVYLEEVAVGFSKTGIPNVIITRALTFLEERANKYLDILTGGALGIRLSGFAATKSGAVRNKIGIDVISANGITTYESYSGGERQRLNIAMLLALRDVAQANKGTNLNCLFLDEVLDLSLDATGAADVMLLMQRKKKDISSIFIISPKEEFIKNSSGNFDTLYQMTKEDGFSKIRGG